jgi:hypothetical protein
MELGLEGRFGFKGRSAVLTAGLAIFFLPLFSLHSQNLVQNGNFEAGGGSFADWQISHDEYQSNYSGPTIVSGGDNDPYYARFTSESEGNDILSQDISTVPGDIYEISFNAEDGDGHNFGTYFDFGNFQDDLNNTFETGPSKWLVGWTNFNFAVTATEDESDLSFIIAADTGSEFGVDDISVVAVPKVIAMPCAGNFQVTVTNCTSQVIIQASTNMVNWVTVCTNTAPCTFTDAACMKFPQRFYRAAVLQVAQQ